MTKKPRGWHSAKAKAARKAAREANRAERRRLDEIDAKLEDLRQRRVEQAVDGALATVDRKTQKWGDLQTKLETERAEYEEREKAARERHKKPPKPKAATTPTGERVMVDEISGRFLVMMKRSFWNREWAGACIRFEADYNAAMFSGLSGQGYDPRVDSSRGAGTTKNLEAAARLRAIEAHLEPEEFMILVLWAGHGMTITQMHARSIGVKDELGRLLKTAAQKLAAFYSNTRFVRQETERFRRMREALEEMVSKVEV